MCIKRFTSTQRGARVEVYGDLPELLLIYFSPDMYVYTTTDVQVDSVEIAGLQGRQCLTGQLEGLDIRRCLNSLKVTQWLISVYTIALRV